MITFLKAILVSSIISTDAVTLTVDRDRPQDGIILSLPGELQYQMKQLDAASLHPFCLSVLYSEPDKQSRSLFHQCYGPGFYRLDLGSAPIVSGGNWKTVSVILESVIGPKDPSRTTATVKLFAAEMEKKK